MHSTHSEEEDKVWKLMQNVHFTFQGADCTYYGMHFGYGLITTNMLLLSAFITWQLSISEASRTLKPIAWALCFSQISLAVVSWNYFFAGPAVFSASVALILAYKCIYWPDSSKKY